MLSRRSPGGNLEARLEGEVSFGHSASRSASWPVGIRPVGSRALAGEVMIPAVTRAGRTVRLVLVPAAVFPGLAVLVVSGWWSLRAGW